MLDTLEGFATHTGPLAGGSADPAMNLQLATALRKAKELGVPKENIEKALSRVRSRV